MVFQKQWLQADKAEKVKNPITPEERKVTHMDHRLILIYQLVIQNIFDHECINYFFAMKISE